MKIFKKLLFISVLLTAVPAGAEIPTVLTDKIRNGSGVIDVFKDASGAELQDYLQSGTLYLGVDLNEDASGIESSTSAGVAIKQMRLIITTTDGDFSSAAPAATRLQAAVALTFPVLTTWLPLETSSTREIL
jgi:hypothetical protein